MGNLLEKWKIGKIEKQLYLCQTSSNHCQFFSHIVKFDFVIRKYFLWNCCDWDYQTCLRVFEKSDENWDFEAPTSFSISDLTFKRFRCLCVRLRFRYWRCGFSVSWSQGANRLKYSAGQVKPQNKIVAFLINWFLNFYWIQYFAAVLKYLCDLWHNILTWSTLDSLKVTSLRRNRHCSCKEGSCVNLNTWWGMKFHFFEMVSWSDRVLN